MGALLLRSLETSVGSAQPDGVGLFVQCLDWYSGDSSARTLLFTLGAVAFELCLPNLIIS